MKITKSLIAALALMLSVSAVSFAQTPAKKHPKETKMATDTTKKAAHHHVKKVKETTKKG
jgi:hypothetical protein